MTVKVELFTADHCPHCVRAVAALETAATELGYEHFELRTLNVVQEIDYAVETGVLATPAIVINGKLIHPIRTTVNAMKTLLGRHLEPGEKNA